ncbi:putative glycosyl hydrolase family 30 protein, partial [Globisporangium splendens]
MVARWILATVIAAALSTDLAIAAPALGCSNYSARYKKDLEGVCVCNTTQCDSVSNDYLNLGPNEASLYRTSRNVGERLRHEKLTFVDGSASDADITIDATTKYQKIIGFGGAFTDAAAINLYKVVPDLQQKILDAYYSENGIQYTLGRIPIASTDFSETIYSYNPKVDDFEMKSFSIDVDRAPNSHKLDLIKRALATTKREITIFASSWAPPIWMTVENRTENCNMKGSPGEPYWKALALYYSKFITAYNNEGIKIWGLTTQNEPDKPIIQPSAWQSLRFTTEIERDFIKKDLGPLLKVNHPEVKIIMMDDNKAHLPDWQAALTDAEARKYVSGIGIHWYMNFDFPFGTGGNFQEMKDFYAKYPDVFMLGTEACEGYLPNILITSTGAGVKITDFNIVWWRAHNYAKDIINDLTSFASGWTDWNLVLDTNGGPNWAKNFVDAPILVDETGGKEFYKQPMYYIMGHFSKFLTPGSQRLRFDAASNSKSRLSSVDWTAFLTPEGRYVAILNNYGDSDQTVKIMAPNGKLVQVLLRATAIQTLVFNA